MSSTSSRRVDMPNPPQNTAPRETDEIRVKKDGGFFGITKPVICRLPNTQPQTAANYTTPFFIADRQYRVIGITARWETAGGGGGGAALQVRKVPSGTAPASGTALLASTIDMTATANTNVAGSLSTTAGVLTLASGDAISLESSGTIAAVVGLTVAVTLRSV